MSNAPLAARALSFDFKNVGDDGDDAAVVYITDDPARNLCQLEISSDEAVTFATASWMRLTFSALIGDAAIEEGLHVTSDDPDHWEIRFVTSGRLRYWSVAPRRSIDLVAGQRVVLRFANVTLKPDAQEGQYPFKIEWNLSGDPLQQDILVLRTRPGPGASHMDALTFGCQALKQEWNVEQNGVQIDVPFKQMDEIFVSPGSLLMKSPIAFFLANASSERAVPKQNNSRFQVSFRVGAGPQALAVNDVEGRDALLGIELQFAGSSAQTPWKIERRTDAGMTFWEMTSLGSHLFETGEVVSFQLQGVQANQDVGIGAIEISYLNFPAYRDNTIQILIHKVAAYATLLEAYWIEGPGEPQFSWKSFGAAGLSAEIYAQKSPADTAPGRVQSIPLPAQGTRALPRPPYSLMALRMADSRGENHVEYLPPIGTSRASGNATPDADSSKPYRGALVACEFRNVSEPGRHAPMVFRSGAPNDNRCEVILTSSIEQRLLHGATISMSFVGNPAIAIGTITAPSGWTIVGTEARVTGTGGVPIGPTSHIVFGVTNVDVPESALQTMHRLKVEWCMAGGDELTFSQHIPVFVSAIRPGVATRSPISAGFQAVSGVNVRTQGVEFEIPWKGKDEVFANHKPAMLYGSSLGFYICNTSIKTLTKAAGSRMEVAFPVGTGVGALTRADGLLPSPELEFVGSSTGTTWTVTKLQDAEGNDVRYELHPKGPMFFEQNEIVSFVFHWMYPPGILHSSGLLDPYAPSLLGEVGIQIVHADVPECQDGITTLMVRKTPARAMLIKAFYSATTLHYRSMQIQWNVFGSMTRLYWYYLNDGSVTMMPPGELEGQRPRYNINAMALDPRRASHVCALGFGDLDASRVVVLFCGRMRS